MGILSVWKNTLDWLPMQPKFLVSVSILIIVSILVTKKSSLSYKIKVLIASLILFYYLCITFSGVFGTPTLVDFHRISEHGSKLFNPNITISHYTSTTNTTFIFNILIFIPIGILCPIISETYGKLKDTILLGFGVSLLIELSHLFTRYKGTDINELIANTLGMIVGYVLLKLVRRMTKNRFLKRPNARGSGTWILPIMIVLTAFAYNFFS